MIFSQNISKCIIRYKKTYLWFWLACILFLIFLLIFINRKWADISTKIVMCDVGQGDSTLIYQGFFQVLIDSGPNDSLLTCLERHMPFWDRKIEVVIVTHYDKDHIGGFSSVFAHYKIGAIIAPAININKTEQTITFENFYESLLEKASEGSFIKRPILGQRLEYSFLNKSPKNNIGHLLFEDLVLSKKKSLPSITLKILSSQIKQDFVLKSDKNTNFLNLPETILSDVGLGYSDTSISENNRSIAVLLSIGEVDVLMTGDLEKEGEQALLAQELITPVEVLKVGHHGAKTSSSIEFLEASKPEISLISCGKNNRYGHPSNSILDKLDEIDSHVFRTDENGEVVLITDGNRIWADID